MQQLFGIFGFSLLALGASTLLGTKSLMRLRHVTPEAAMAAIRALDTDHSGKVEKNEVEAFARQQGLSAEQVSLEFKDLDVNGNGELEEDEISTSLSSQPPLAEKASLPAAKTAEASARKPTPAASVVQGESVLAAPAASAARVASAPAEKLESERWAWSSSESKENSAANLEQKTSNATNTSHQGPPALKTPEPPHTAASKTAINDLIQEEMMLTKAKEQASRAVAEAFAGSASTAFVAQQQDDSQAQNLTKMAKSLRGRAAEIASTAHEQVEAAAAKAAASVLEAQAPTVLRMQQEAANLTADADERRKKAKETMEQVMKAQAEMREMAGAQ